MAAATIDVSVEVFYCYVILLGFITDCLICLHGSVVLKAKTMSCKPEKMNAIKAVHHKIIIKGWKEESLPISNVLASNLHLLFKPNRFTVMQCIYQ